MCKRTWTQADKYERQKNKNKTRNAKNSPQGVYSYIVCKKERKKYNTRNNNNNRNIVLYDIKYKPGNKIGKQQQQNTTRKAKKSL